jgi:hypothetical protein
LTGVECKRPLRSRILSARSGLVKPKHPPCLIQEASRRTSRLDSARREGVSSPAGHLVGLDEHGGEELVQQRPQPGVAGIALNPKTRRRDVTTGYATRCENVTSVVETLETETRAGEGL